MSIHSVTHQPKMRMRRALSIALLTLFALPVASLGQSAPESVLDRERFLKEKLLDISAVVRSGTNIADYKRHISELVILDDRYTRIGGNNPNLYTVTLKYKAAVDAWEMLNKARYDHATDRMASSSVELTRLYQKMEQSREEYLQNQWTGAEEALKEYETELDARTAAAAAAAAAAAKPKRSQQRPNTKERKT